MVAAGQCPGIKTGNRFLVNITALAEMLDAMSRKSDEQNSWKEQPANRQMEIKRV